MQPYLPKIDLKTDQRFTYTKNPNNVNANIIQCNHCRFKRADTFLGCSKAAEDHIRHGHWIAE